MSNLLGHFSSLVQHGFFFFQIGIKIQYEITMEEKLSWFIQGERTFIQPSSSKNECFRSKFSHWMFAFHFRSKISCILLLSWIADRATGVCQESTRKMAYLDPNFYIFTWDFVDILNGLYLSSGWWKMTHSPCWFFPNKLTETFRAFILFQGQIQKFGWIFLDSALFLNFGPGLLYKFYLISNLCGT